MFTSIATRIFQTYWNNQEKYRTELSPSFIECGFSQPIKPIINFPSPHYCSFIFLGIFSSPQKSSISWCFHPRSSDPTPASPLMQRRPRPLSDKMFPWCSHNWHGQKTWRSGGFCAIENDIFNETQIDLIGFFLWKWWLGLGAMLDLASDQCYMAHMSHGAAHDARQGRFRLHCVLQLPSDGISLLRVHVHGRERYHRRGEDKKGRLQFSVLSIDESVDFVIPSGKLTVGPWKSPFFNGN